MLTPCRPQRAASRRTSAGAALLESMIAVVIISLGVLAIVGMQAVAVQATTDSRFRTEASYLIDSVIGQMLLNVDRSSAAATQTSITSFLHNTADGDACLFDGSATSSSIISSWITKVTGSSGLPGATTDHIQIRQDSTANAGNRLIITIGWVTPWDSQCHKQSAVAYIN